MSHEIYTTLQHAVSKGVMFPRIRIERFTFTPSKYPETMYVKHTETKTYLGKVIGSTFIPNSRWGITVEERDDINKILATPLEEAIRVHGQQTGQCCFCGRTLLNGLSIAASIGPICAEKYGISQEAEAARYTEQDLRF